MVTSSISYLVLRKTGVESDWKLRVQPKEDNNGRKVLVNEIYPAKEVGLLDREQEKANVVYKFYGLLLRRDAQVHPTAVARLARFHDAAFREIWHWNPLDLTCVVLHPPGESVKRAA